MKVKGNDFSKLMTRATKDLTPIAEAITAGREHVGKLVAIDLRKESTGEEGTIIVKIAPLLMHLPGQVAKVVASNFAPIWADRQRFSLQLRTLAWNRPPRYPAPQFTHEQKELWKALRWALGDLVPNTRQSTELQPELVVGEQVEQEQSPEPTAEAPKPPLATVEMQLTHLTTKPKFWRGENTFYHVYAGHRAYFRREVEAGVGKFAFIGADHDHPLSAILDEHREVQVDIAPVLRGDVKSPDGDLHDIRVARQAVQVYLMSVLEWLGHWSDVQVTK